MEKNVVIKPKNGICYGTSFFGCTIYATRQELEKVFGEYHFHGSPDDKIAYEWDFIFSVDGEEFETTIYDWKEVCHFSYKEKIYWHIGSKNSFSSNVAMEIINQMLGNEEHGYNVVFE